MSSVQKEWIAITGGSGYIGSNIAAAIKKNTHYKTLIIDNRANKMRHTHQYADLLLNADYASSESIDTIDTVSPKVVIHCAASTLVGPSVIDPAKYYNNNVNKLISFIDSLRSLNHNNIIFSSSSSVYGEGYYSPICSEDINLMPLSPYGRTKQAGEMILLDYASAYNMNVIAFRFFNVAGASVELGQIPGASHIIPKIFDSINSNTKFVINGTNLDTPDGTCIRDYVHVDDIAQAHLLAINYIINNQGYNLFNVGSGKSTSVKELISIIESVTGLSVSAIAADRRPGDPKWKVASITKIKNILGWEPKKDIKDIVQDAFNWYNCQVYKNIIKG